MRSLEIAQDSHRAGRWPIPWSPGFGDSLHSLHHGSLADELHLWVPMEHTCVVRGGRAGAGHLGVCDLPAWRALSVGPHGAHVCGAGWDGWSWAPWCVWSPWHLCNFFPFLNFKMTPLEAPSKELTLEWKEDLFRVRALFLWMFCLPNHGECEPGGGREVGEAEEGRKSV